MENNKEIDIFNGLSKDEVIEHWTEIVRAVFSAEYSIQPKYIDKLKAHTITPDEYCRVIAEEIVSKSVEYQEKVKNMEDSMIIENGGN